MSWLRASNRVLTESAFLDFITDCFNARLSYSVPNFARSWLAVYEKLKFNRQVISGSFAVKMALHGYESLSQQFKSVRRPLLLEKLRLLMSPSVPKSVQKCLLLGYVFLLRTSEVISLTQGEGKIERVRCGFTLYLKRSKGDPMGKGVSVFFKLSEIPLWCQGALADMQPEVCRHVCPAPENLNATIHRLLGADFTFHCLRHGRATELFKAGTPISRIMVLGRWATKEAVVCYLH